MENRCKEEGYFVPHFVLDISLSATIGECLRPTFFRMGHKDSRNCQVLNVLQVPHAPSRILRPTANHDNCAQRRPK